MNPIFLADVSRLSSDTGFPELLAEGAFCIETGKGSAEIYGRFMGGSDQNTDSLGQFEQSVQFKHMAQSRINTGDCASR